MMSKLSINEHLWDNKTHPRHHASRWRATCRPRSKQWTWPVSCSCFIKQRRHCKQKSKKGVSLSPLGHGGVIITCVSMSLCNMEICESWTTRVIFLRRQHMSAVCGHWTARNASCWLLVSAARPRRAAAARRDAAACSPEVDSGLDVEHIPSPLLRLSCQKRCTERFPVPQSSTHSSHAAH